MLHWVGKISPRHNQRGLPAGGICTTIKETHWNFSPLIIKKHIGANTADKKHPLLAVSVSVRLFRCEAENYLYSLHFVRSIEATTLKLILNTLLGKREQFDNTLFMPKHVDLPRLRMIQNKLICKSFKMQRFLLWNLRWNSVWGPLTDVCQHTDQWQCF